MLTLIKTGHPEEGRALSSLAPAHQSLYVFVFVVERQSQEAAKRVHQSSERGALAAGSLECGVERNLYCPIVPLFPRSHHTPARPVHLQVSSANQPRIPFHRRILSSAATRADQQHTRARTEVAQLERTRTERKSSRRISADRDLVIPHPRNGTETRTESVYVTLPSILSCLQSLIWLLF